jgi:hypothetical protein
MLNLSINTIQRALGEGGSTVRSTLGWTGPWMPRRGRRNRRGRPFRRRYPQFESLEERLVLSFDVPITTYNLPRTFSGEIVVSRGGMVIDSSTENGTFPVPAPPSLNNVHSLRSEKLVKDHALNCDPGNLVTDITNSHYNTAGLHTNVDVSATPGDVKAVNVTMNRFVLGTPAPNPFPLGNVTVEFRLTKSNGETRSGTVTLQSSSGSESSGMATYGATIAMPMRLDGPVKVDVVFTGQVIDPNVGPPMNVPDANCPGVMAAVQSGQAAHVFTNVVTVLTLDEPTGSNALSIVDSQNQPTGAVPLFEPDPAVAHSIRARQLQTNVLEQVLTVVSGRPGPVAQRLDALSRGALDTTIMRLDTLVPDDARYVITAPVFTDVVATLTSREPDDDPIAVIDLVLEPGSEVRSDDLVPVPAGGTILPGTFGSIVFVPAVVGGSLVARSEGLTDATVAVVAASMPPVGQGAAILNVSGALPQDAGGVGLSRPTQRPWSPPRSIEFGLGPWSEPGRKLPTTWIPVYVESRNGSAVRRERAAAERTVDHWTDYKARDLALSDFSVHRRIDLVIDELLPALH